MFQLFAAASTRDETNSKYSDSPITKALIENIIHEKQTSATIGEM